MENDKKEELETRSDPKMASYASSSNILPSDPEELTKVFEKNLEGLENLVKLFKSDVSKMFDISDPNFPGSLINASPEKWSSAWKNCWAMHSAFGQIVRQQ